MIDAGKKKTKKGEQKMTTKTRKATVKGNVYEVATVVAGKVRQQTVVAKNIREAGVKAKRLFPKSHLVTVSRKTSRKGTEYETYTIINRANIS